MRERNVVLAEERREINLLFAEEKERNKSCLWRGKGENETLSLQQKMREIILLLTGEKAGAGRAPTPKKSRPQCREQHIKSSTWSKTITNIQKMVISDFSKDRKVGWFFFSQPRARCCKSARGEVL